MEKVSKKLLYGSDARKKILNGINEVANAVKVTHGPKGRTVKMEQVLINEEKYCGQYVATKDFGGHVVVASGKDPKKVYEEAIKKGCSEPVIVFVPLKDMVQIYFKIVK